MNIKKDTPLRQACDVRSSDFVEYDGDWYIILYKTSLGNIITTNHKVLAINEISRFAKAEDMEGGHESFHREIHSEAINPNTFEVSDVDDLPDPSRNRIGKILLIDQKCVIIQWNTDGIMTYDRNEVPGLQNAKEQEIIHAEFAEDLDGIDQWLSVRVEPPYILRPEIPQ